MFLSPLLSAEEATSTPSTEQHESSLAESENDDRILANVIGSGLVAWLLYGSDFDGLELIDIVIIACAVCLLVFWFRRQSGASPSQEHSRFREEPTFAEQALQNEHYSVETGLRESNLHLQAQRTINTAPQPQTTVTPVRGDITIPYTPPVHAQQPAAKPTKQPPVSYPENLAVSASDPDPIAEEVANPPPQPNTRSAAVQALASLEAEQVNPHFEQFDLPPNFNPEQYLEQAKADFKQLHHALTHHQDSVIASLTSPELYEQLLSDRENMESQPSTSIVTVFNDITHANHMGDISMLSIKFHGWMKLSDQKDVIAYAHLWHLEKLSSEDSWKIVGIQQLR